jgi:phosphatidylinositol alpha-1,6-mannosyltransferase
MSAKRICRQCLSLVHLGDPVLAPFGWILQKLFQTPIVITVHGLDITYPFFPYQQIVPRLVGQFCRVVCISNLTQTACLERGIPAPICTVISPGVEVPPDLPTRAEARAKLSQLAGQNLEASELLLTVGRLVPRKGVASFVRRVLPSLSAQIPCLHYLVVGTGPDHRVIRHAVREQGLEPRVHMLGHVEEEDLAFIYRGADVFVAPNIPYPGNMEGFGLVVLEASAMALPIVASDLEGLKNAIVPGGILLPHDQPDRWIDELATLLENVHQRMQLGKKARRYVAAHRSWSAMADRYLALFETVLAE